MHRLEGRCQYEFSFFRLVWAVGAAEKKIQNCPKHAAFEAIFLCFHDQNE